MLIFFMLLMASGISRAELASDSELDGGKCGGRRNLRLDAQPEPWRQVLDANGELWARITAEDASDYSSRRRISLAEISAPAHCAPASVCGVWAHAGLSHAAHSGGKHAAPICMDLCVDTEYMPALPALAAARTREEEEEEEEAQQYIMRAQFPGEFDVLAVRPAASPLSGFGVTMVYAAHNLAKALTSRRIWVPSRNSLQVWTSEAWCGHERSLRCYFLSPTNASIEIIGAAADEEEEEPVAAVARQLDAEREGAAAGIDGIAHDFAPPHLARKGAFWVHSQCLQFIWQPNSKTQAYLTEVRLEMARRNPEFAHPFRKAVIGMHVRRGDSFMAARWMPGLEAFLFHARRMQAAYGVRHIFLATDCEETVRECSVLTDFSCTSLPLSRELYDVGSSKAPEHNPKESAYDQWIERRIQLGEVDGATAALHAIAEVDTLASCDFLIGRLDSAISRLALMLMSARRGPRPFISLDKPWAQPPFALIN